MTDEATPTHYEVLGVASDASPGQLRDAYRNIARRLHPDTQGAPPDAEVLMSVLNEAYATLSNPSERQAYDALLERDAHTTDPHTSLEPMPTPSSPLSAMIAVLVALGIINLGLGFATSGAGAITFGLVFLIVGGALSVVRFRQALKSGSDSR